MTTKTDQLFAETPPGILSEPPDLLRFVSNENHNFMIVLANHPEEFEFVQHVHGLFRAAMSKQSADDSQIVIFQLLTLVHYHFLFATSCYMRCHLSDAFNSVRIAIDAALAAAHIIQDRPSQTAYLNRTKPFDKLLRHYKNLIRDKKHLPHGVIEHLVKMHDFCSQIASHADADTFVHRLQFHGEPGQERLMAVHYFQFVHDRSVFKHHFLGLLHIFITTLDIFADFIVDEHKSLPAAWREELRTVGRRIEDRQKLLRPDAANEQA